MKSANPTDAARRRYFLEIAGSMAAYVVILVASIHVLNGGLTNPWRTIVALTPVIPVVLVFVSLVRFMLSIDELQRQIQLESMAFAAGFTALAAVTYGFLETAGFPRPSAWLTYVVVMVAWGIAVPIVTRRYK
ncbi:MAG: hypothetical protein JO165_03090 [Candidatus Eremiobacteraeota bacterium]|nr:hypothetical protein [Candidatus Eremiobacteraeota bacterium]